MTKRKTTATGGSVPRQPKGSKRATARTVAAVGIVAMLRQAIAEAEAAGVTRYRIAQLSGVSNAMLSRFASGQSVPKLDTAEKIVRALGCRMTICVYANAGL